VHVLKNSAQSCTNLQTAVIPLHISAITRIKEIQRNRAHVGVRLIEKL